MKEKPNRKRKFLIDKIKKPKNEEDIYNLENDSNAHEKLFDKSIYPKISLELRQKLLNWMKKPNYPLLKCKI